ncbi:MAG: hypothetical protein K6F68_06305 [Clostridiales bacterium]|nr:hypothetical protein [Clostridiales bacterium]
MNGKDERLISYAENELMNKEGIRDAVIRESASGRTFNRRRALVPVAACLLAAVITVLAIPRARAEVLSWFKTSSPDEYLRQGEGKRTPIEALDEIIVKPGDRDEWGNQIGSVTDNRVLFTADEPVWREIADDFKMELGETMVDGDKMYLSVRLGGLTALPEVDAATGGNATRTHVPQDQVSRLFEEGKTPKELLDGSGTLWEPAFGRICLVLEDGTELELYGLDSLMYDPGIGEHLRRINSEFGLVGWTTDEALQAGISRQNAEWLKGKSLMGTVKFDLESLTLVDYGFADPMEFLSRYADENGILRARAVYRALSWTPNGYEKKLEAELGTACFDIRAFQRLEKHDVAAAPAALASGTAILSYTEWVEANNSYRYNVKNLEAELSGVRFEALDGAFINGLGLMNVRVRVTFPAAWTPEQCAAFSQCLVFFAEADGERFIPSNMEREKTGEREYVFTFTCVNFPYSMLDMLEGIEEVRLVPVLRHIETMCLSTGEKRAMPLNEAVERPEGGWFEDGGELILTDVVLAFRRK